MLFAKKSNYGCLSMPIVPPNKQVKSQAREAGQAQCKKQPKNSKKIATHQFMMA
jgi:hypothetical protein